jgi:hypothetical protein
MKKTLASIVLGLVLAAVPIAVFATCAASITVNGKKCTLSGSSSGGGVEICYYNCGPNPN